jgi:hypothetical protein
MNGKRRPAAGQTAPVTAPVTQETPEFNELLGGPGAQPAPPEAPTPAPAPEQTAAAAAPPPCLTFEDVLAAVDRAPAIQDTQAVMQAVERERPNIVWCEGVREGFMLALATPTPPRRPEAPRPRVFIGAGTPPGDDGGPGYTG